MKKFIPIIIIVLIILISGVYLLSSKDTNIKKTKYSYLKDLDEYKDLKLENISYVEETHYTEGGDDTKKIENKDEITRMYNMVMSIKLKKETTMACEDNTIVYRFYMNDNKQINVVFECNILVVKNKRYLVKE